MKLEDTAYLQYTTICKCASGGMVDALAWGASEIYSRGGSSPLSRTNIKKHPKRMFLGLAGLEHEKGGGREKAKGSPVGVTWVEDLS